jgi:hypothetical protein
MVMNILSLDIDYAYSPTISIYDDFVVGSNITLDEQRELFAQHDLPLPTVNSKKISLLKSKLSGKVSVDSRIIITNHHHDILEFLPKNEFILYNIDHHHDIFYPGWHDIEKLDEGNWAHRLRGLECKKYVWIRNEDSENLDSSVIPSFVYEETYLENIDFPTFDLVFCCVSPHWTGEEGREILVNLLGEIL